MFKRSQSLRDPIPFLSDPNRKGRPVDRNTLLLSGTPDSSLASPHFVPENIDLEHEFDDVKASVVHLHTSGSSSQR